jgi:hypothetical protein
MKYNGCELPLCSLDNKFAVLEVFLTSSALVRDALAELEQVCMIS